MGPQYSVPASRNLWFCFFLVIIFVEFGHAQGRRGGGDPSANLPNPPPQKPITFDERELLIKGNINRPASTPMPAEETACYLPPLGGAHGTTVGLQTMEVQIRAKRDYDSICDSLRKRNLDVAERRLRDAIKKYPEYPTLWILLAQVLERRKEFDEAHDSCSQAAKANSAFVPAYLCFADVASHQGDWPEVLAQTNYALTLDGSTNSITYLYRATAYFVLHSFNDAEKDAIRGMEIAKSHPNPRMNYLLAQIYGAKGDHNNEVIQLREFLKLAGNSETTASVKQYLSKLERDLPPGSGAR